MKLVLVESPTKAKTISKFLGKGYEIAASLGHVRDLPEDKFGVDVENDFKPTYVIIPRAKERIRELKKKVEKAELVLLSTDPDREGESIAYHLAYLLNLGKRKPYWRIVFHEITKEAIEEALRHPRKIDMRLVSAQQARRILDRIVGYKLSPFLWRKIAGGLSAGRVQSVALRLIVEREKEIENFKPQEYWTIEAILKKIQNSNLKIQNEFKALLVKKDGKQIPQLGIKNEKEAKKIVEDLKEAEFKIEKVEKKERKRNPPEPFMTSTMQQVAGQNFKWPAEMTMKIAQQLYEKGFITYHRTDSLNLSKLALEMAKKYILKNFKEDYYKERIYKTKSKVAQEAHEAIRPTDVEKTPEEMKGILDSQQLKLYDLIWKRFLASQMSEAVFDATSVEIEAKVSKKLKYTFKATGQILKFDGFLKVYPIKFEEEELPQLKEGEELKVIKIIPLQHFTQPPPRYTEATLIRELEKNGIGRPSTYAPILSTIQQRNYVKKDEKKRLYPTEIGRLVSDFLVTHFPEIVDINFTAKMEDDLDKVARGELVWVPALRNFFDPFNAKLKEKNREIKGGVGILQQTEKKCPQCGSPLLLRVSKYGKFLACSAYPKCRFTQDLENSTGIPCPKCQEGEIVKRKSRKGKIFYGCSGWPKCDLVLWGPPNGEKCPECNALLYIENNFLKCSNCDFKKERE